MARRNKKQEKVKLCETLKLTDNTERIEFYFCPFCDEIILLPDPCKHYVYEGINYVCLVDKPKKLKNYFSDEDELLYVGEVEYIN